MTKFDDSIFKADKSQYATPSIFLGEAAGLFDTIHKPFPKLWAHYKTLKSLDWDENEIDYSGCLTDFQNCSEDIYDAMIKTLAWQWEADSVAANSLMGILAPFITSSEALASWSKIAENEVLHSATYSEIVRSSFKDPDSTLQEILEVQEALSRLTCIAKVCNDASKAGAEYTLGLVENDQTLYNRVYLFIVAVFVLERIQFMSSFAVTFSICDTGLFIPFGKAVQKIAQDELEVHVQMGKDVLRYEAQTDRGKEAARTLGSEVQALISEVVNAELEWVDFLFSGGRSLVGLNADVLKQWVLFNARDVYNHLGLESPYDMPAKNPLKFMEHWLNMNKIQTAPQETEITAYKVGVLRRDDEDMDFETDF